MSNVVEFKQPPKKQEPKAPKPGQRKLLIVLAIAAALVAVWAYFHFVSVAAPGV